MNKLEKSIIAVVAIIVIGFFGIVGYRLCFLTFVENYEFAYSYDYRTGEMDSLKGSGYFKTIPLVYAVHTIDKRPTQVTMNANNRVLNAKLVEFDTRGWKTFVAWHGRNDYSNDGSGGGTSNGTLNEILRSYAYDGQGKTYPFLHIIRELKNDNEVPVTKSDSTKVQ